MIIDKIEKMVEEKRMTYGDMGTETTTVVLELTEAEKEEFHYLKLDEHWTWNFEGNVLYITYVEEL